MIEMLGMYCMSGDKQQANSELVQYVAHGTAIKRMLLKYLHKFVPRQYFYCNLHNNFSILIYATMNVHTGAYHIRNALCRRSFPHTLLNMAHDDKRRKKTHTQKWSDDSGDIEENRK